MPVTADQPAPYAPASAILDLIARHRSKGLPSPVDAGVLGRAGISDSLISRTLQALLTLDLITEDGKPSAVLEGIRLASEAEYQQRLKDWLTNAYADAVQYVDPETADEGSIRDAFRGYKPIGQQERMVSLFSALFRAAGVGPEKTGTTPRKVVPTVKAKPRVSTKPDAKPVIRSKNNGETGGISITTAGLPLPLAGLLAKLPADGESWTQHERDIFLQTFSAVVDFCFPITYASKGAKDSQSEDE